MEHKEGEQRALPAAVAVWRRSPNGGMNMATVAVWRGLPQRRPALVARTRSAARTTSGPSTWLALSRRAFMFLIPRGRVCVCRATRVSSRSREHFKLVFPAGQERNAPGGTSTWPILNPKCLPEGTCAFKGAFRVANWPSHQTLDAGPPDHQTLDAGRLAVPSFAVGDRGVPSFAVGDLARRKE